MCMDSRDGWDSHRPDPDLGGEKENKTNGFWARLISLFPFMETGQGRDTDMPALSQKGYGVTSLQVMAEIT